MNTGALALAVGLLIAHAFFVASYLRFKLRLKAFSSVTHTNELHSVPETAVWSKGGTSEAWCSLMHG